MKRYIYSAESSNVHTRRLRAMDRSTPPEVLAQLANDEDKEVRGWVANNPNTSAEVLAHLASDDSWQVRAWVAGNSNIPVKILTQLANDADEGVRFAVAQNPNTPAEVIAQLANDADEEVRHWAVRNPNAPAEIRVQPKNDENDEYSNPEWPDAGYWDTIDSRYMMEDAWEMYLSEPESQVNDELQIYPEPSTQGGWGWMYIVDESGEDRFKNGQPRYDYVDWCDAEMDMAAESSSPEEYAEKYRKFVSDICGF